MELTQKNWNELFHTLNHRMTDIENDIKWIKKFMYYNVTMITLILVGVIVGVII